LYAPPSRYLLLCFTFIPFHTHTHTYSVCVLKEQVAGIEFL
jgi:hypothetical protein